MNAYIHTYTVCMYVCMRIYVRTNFLPWYCNLLTNTGGNGYLEMFGAKTKAGEEEEIKDVENKTTLYSKQV